jgi:hypothetical protein
MSKKLNNILAQVLLATIFMFAACGTDVELCEKTEHPHSGHVSFIYKWGAYTDLPDSMYLVAYRSANSFKSVLSLCCEDTTNAAQGRFLFNKPVFVKSELPSEDSVYVDSIFVSEDIVDGEVSEAKTRSAGEQGWNGLLKTGVYKFITFNVDTTQLACTRISDFVTDNAESDDLWVEYKRVNKDADELKSLMPDWKDFNEYSDYVLPALNPIYYAATRKWVKEGGCEINLHPSRVTQALTLRFNISKSGVSKVPFIVDSVKAEISGVPSRMNISNGYMDISKTHKMLLDVDFIDGAGEVMEDSAKCTYLRCRSKINVPTIVNAESTKMTTGPGIMQLIIYTHLEGEAKTNVIQTKINLYNTLSKAKLYSYVDEHRYVKRRISGTTLGVTANLTINAKKLSENGDNSGGLDQWTSEGDIDIEL